MIHLACYPADAEDEDNLVDFARKKREEEQVAAKEGKRPKREQKEEEEEKDGKGERLPKGCVSAVFW